VPPYAIVAGNSARVVRMRYDPQDVDRLLHIRWWDWDAEKITRNLPAISGGDVSALAAAT
jgi:virginiamycin A acetyltransferase